jgi:hypothetical protein
MKLTKTQEKEYNALREKVEASLTDLNNAIIHFNEQRSAFESFRDGVYGEIESFVDDKSDRWREGETGAAHEAWKDEWSEEICDEVEEIDAELREYPMEPEG